MHKYYLTCDIGGTDIKYGIITENYDFIYTSSLPTKSMEGGLAIIEQIVQIYKSLVIDYEIEAIAISAAGIIHPVTTEVLSATDNIKNYIGINFRNEINKYIDINVSVENDVNCVALAETTLGAGKSFNNAIAMTIGTGIGGAIINNKNLYHGSSFSAGEWGRTVTDFETFTKYEEIASTKALVNSAKKIRSSIKNGVDVFKLYDNNDEEITPLVHKFYENLTTGMINIIYTYSPEAIIIGGGITSRGNKFLNEIMDHIEPKIDKYFLSKTQIIIAHFKNNAGMIGALINYKKHF